MSSKRSLITKLSVKLWHAWGMQMKTDLWHVFAVSMCEGVMAIGFLIFGLLKLKADPNYWIFTAVVMFIAVLTYRRYRRQLKGLN
jgi:cobalamin synthase